MIKLKKISGFCVGKAKKIMIKLIDERIRLGYTLIKLFVMDGKMSFTQNWQFN